MFFSLVGKIFLASNKTVYEVCMYNSLSDHITLKYINFFISSDYETKKEFAKIGILSLQ